MLFEHRRGPSELAGQCHQLDDAGLRVSELGRYRRAQAILHGTALSTVPRDRQVGDLFECAAELFGALNEGEPLERPLVVHAVAGLGAFRSRQKPDLLVVAKARRREAAATRHLSDAECRAHASTLNLQVDLKVKQADAQGVGSRNEPL
jgi:hypothetical protein